MMKGLMSWSSVMAVAILSLQFLTVPYLGDIDRAGKLFVFSFITLVCALFFIRIIPFWKFSSVSVVLSFFWLVFVASAFQAINPVWALIQSAIFGVFLIYLFMTTHFAAQQTSFPQKVVSVLLLFGLLAATLGLFEYIHFQLLGPTSTMLIPYLVPADLNARVVGPYGQPNLFALFLTLSILAFFYRYIHLPDEAQLLKVTWARFIPFIVVALVFFLTGSIAGLLSISLIFVFLTGLVLTKRYLVDDPAGRREFFLLILCLGVSFLISKGFSGVVSSMPLRDVQGVQLGVDARFVFWMSSVLIFLDFPWLGIGLDNFGFVQNAYGPLSHSTLGFVPYEAMLSSDWSHNELLQILCEGGFLAFGLAMFLLVVLFKKIIQKFIIKPREADPFFLYSHLFILPFVFQSMFSWPFRSPPLLVLFFTLLGGLLSQYPMKRLKINSTLKKVLTLVLFIGVSLVFVFFYQEVKIGSFKRNFIAAHNIEKTFNEFEMLANSPYSEYRVLSKALHRFAREALVAEDDLLAKAIVPYYERLVKLEGARWQWYDLARLYLKTGREGDARESVQHAIDLMPSDQRPWSFQHYMNMLQASRDTGRPLESFWPRGKKIDFNMLELLDE